MVLIFNAIHVIQKKTRSAIIKKQVGYYQYSEKRCVFNLINMVWVFFLPDNRDSTVYNEKI